MTSIEAHILIQRPATEVLEAFLHSRHTELWWNGACTSFQPQHQLLSWQWRHPNQPQAWQYLTHSRIQAYTPGLHLQLTDIWQYSNTDDGPLGPAQLLLECTPLSGSTMLVVQHSGFTEANARWQTYAHEVEAGWNLVLPQLKAYLERTRA